MYTVAYYWIGLSAPEFPSGADFLSKHTYRWRWVAVLDEFVVNTAPAFGFGRVVARIE